MKNIALAAAAAFSLTACAAPKLTGLDLVGQVPSQAALAECEPKLAQGSARFCERRSESGRVAIVERLGKGPVYFGQSIVVVGTEKDRELAKGLLQGVLPEELESAGQVEQFEKTSKSDGGVFTPEMAERSFLAPAIYLPTEKIPGVTAEQARADLGDRFAVVYKFLSVDVKDGVKRSDRKNLVSGPAL